MIASAQMRDFRGEQIVIDDNGADAGWNTMTIKTANPLPINTVLTIPNPGTGTANFLLSESATPQIVNANLNFTGSLNFAGATVTGFSGAGLGEPFITASASPSLTAERILTGGTGVTVTDGGANSTMTISIGQSVATSAAPTFAGLTIPTGNIAVTTGNFSITTGNISTAVGNISTSSGSITASSGNLTAGNGGELRLTESGGSDYSAFKAAAQSGNITYTLPTSSGSAGQFLRIASSPTPSATAASLEWASATGSSGFGSVGGVAFAGKTASEGVTSSTTLQNDDHLFVALNANEVYEVEGVLYASTTNNSHDLQIAFAVPAGATMKITYHSREENGSTVRQADQLTSSGVAGTVMNVQTTDQVMVFIKGIVRTAGTAGNVTLQWSDDDTGGTETVTLNIDSYIKVTRLQ